MKAAQVGKQVMITCSAKQAIELRLTLLELNEEQTLEPAMLELLQELERLASDGVRI